MGIWQKKNSTKKDKIIFTPASRSVTVSFTQYGSAEVRSSWSLLTTINGALVGMVSICAGCNTLKPWAAFLTGVLSSVFYFAISIGLVSRQIDDPLEAVAGRPTVTHHRSGG